jgi:hypothetical protein
LLSSPGSLSHCRSRCHYTITAPLSKKQFFNTGPWISLHHQGSAKKLHANLRKRPRKGGLKVSKHKFVNACASAHVIRGSTWCYPNEHACRHEVHCKDRKCITSRIEPSAFHFFWFHDLIRLLHSFAQLFAAASRHVTGCHPLFPCHFVVVNSHPFKNSRN